MRERVEEWVAWTTAAFATVFLIFVLTAPLVMTRIVRTQGCCQFPAAYEPFMTIIQSDYGGPLLWYFNNVWGAEIALIGEETGPPFHMILLYSAILLALLGALAFPFLRRWRSRIQRDA